MTEALKGRIEKLVKARSTDMGYEVWAPEGHHYADGPHSLVAYDMKEAREIAKSAEYEPCPADCECKEPA